MTYLMTYRISTIREDGKAHYTDFSGHQAETYALRCYYDAENNKHVTAVFMFCSTGEIDSAREPLFQLVKNAVRG